MKRVANETPIYRYIFVDCIIVVDYIVVDYIALIRNEVAHRAICRA